MMILWFLAVLGCLGPLQANLDRFGLFWAVSDHFGLLPTVGYFKSLQAVLG
jgi:hypothetical protein